MPFWPKNIKSTGSKILQGKRYPVYIGVGGLGKPPPALKNPPEFGALRKLIKTVSSVSPNIVLTIVRPPKKRCRILPAGGLGVSPSFQKIPQGWGI
jgi:hypothetical protein